jgi:epoxyqueuosine reductase
MAELTLREASYRPRYAYRLETWRRMADPRAALAGARSVVVLGYCYNPLPRTAMPAGARGRVARIVAYGHLGIARRARLVADYLRRRGFRVVTGAHRKEAAVRAGLGMIGKHDLVINPTYGSWVAYQTLITDAGLEPDRPFTEDLCGDCAICLSACPTKALHAPHRLDPRRCIAYLLTDRGTPQACWPLMDNWILGCDVCQERCPRNRERPVKEEQPSFLPQGIGLAPPLAELLAMTEPRFQREVMAHAQRQLGVSACATALMRVPGAAALLKWVVTSLLKGREKLPETFVHASSSLDVYRRNAVIAAANRDRRELLPLIRPLCQDRFLGACASWAVARLEGRAQGGDDVAQ